MGRIYNSIHVLNTIHPSLIWSFSSFRLVSPFLIRELVSVLDKRNNSTSSDSLSTYGFLYGVFPTAPSVFIYATQYGCEPEMVSPFEHYKNPYSNIICLRSNKIIELSLVITCKIMGQCLVLVDREV